MGTTAPTKTGEVNAGIRIGCRGREWVRYHLKRLYDRARGPRERLFRVDLREYEEAFRAAVRGTGLERLNVCPHAVRHAVGRPARRPADVAGGPAARHVALAHLNDVLSEARASVAATQPIAGATTSVGTCRAALRDEDDDKPDAGMSSADFVAQLIVAFFVGDACAREAFLATEALSTRMIASTVVGIGYAPSGLHVCGKRCRILQKVA